MVALTIVFAFLFSMMSVTPIMAAPVDDAFAAALHASLCTSQPASTDDQSVPLQGGDCHGGALCCPGSMASGIVPEVHANLSLVRSEFLSDTYGVAFDRHIAMTDRAWHDQRGPPGLL